MNSLLNLIRAIALIAVVAIVAGLLTHTAWHNLTTLDLFWMGIVPLVPLWLLISPQTWRQVCPVATVNLAAPNLPGRRRSPLAAKLSASSALWLRRNGLIVAAAILWIVVPARLVLFNTDATATGLLIISIAVVAGIMGFVMPWKSGWCTSICPVYPVEKLYGAAPFATRRDVRCESHGESKSCLRCALFCADIPAGDDSYWEAMRNVPPKGTVNAARHFFIGSFPGFVLGYVLIWAYAHISEVSIGSVLFVYGTVAVLMFVSYAIYRALLSGAERASGESGSRARRTTAITMLVALNIYYIAGANGIATVISRIAAREDLVTATMISILAIVAATSLVWLKRAWRLPLQPYMQW